jgi:cell division protein FtsZ
MKGMGKAVMGTGVCNGENRAMDAAKRAINSPLLEEASMDGARGILINITAGESLTLHEVNQACQLIRENADPSAEIIFGATIDDKMNDNVKVTVIATGFDHVGERGMPALSVTRNDIPMTQQAQAALQQQENLSFYRKAAGQTPNPVSGGTFPFEDKDDLDIPTFKRKS